MIRSARMFLPLSTKLSQRTTFPTTSMALASHCLMSCIGNWLYSVKVQKERKEIQVATRMSAHAARNYYEMSRSCPRSVGLWRVLRTGCDLHRSSFVRRRRRRRRCDRTGIINGKILRTVAILSPPTGATARERRPFDRKVERLFVLPRPWRQPYPSYHR